MDVCLPQHVLANDGFCLMVEYLDNMKFHADTSYRQAFPYRYTSECEVPTALLRLLYALIVIYVFSESFRSHTSVGYLTCTTQTQHLQPSTCSSRNVDFIAGLMIRLCGARARNLTSSSKRYSSSLTRMDRSYGVRLYSKS